MNIIVFPTLLFFGSVAAAGRHSYAVTFLKDFAENDGKISYLIGFLCWSRGDQLNLVKSLSRNGMYATVHDNCTSESFNTLNIHRTLFVVDTLCPIAENCLKMANASSYFSSPYNWLILDSFLNQLNDNSEVSNENENGVLNTISNECETPDPNFFECPINYINKFSLLVDSNVVFAKKQSDQKNILLYQNYRRRKEDLNIILETYGTWDEKNGITDMRLIKEIAVRRLNLHRIKITTSVVITNNSTMNHLSDGKERHVDTLTKVNYALSAHLMDFVNSTPNFIFTNGWGFPTSKGGYSGMIGHIIRHEAEIGGTPLFFRADRMGFLEFISLTTPTTASFVFKEPPLSSVNNIFVMPFEWTVWVAMVLFVTLSCISLYFTNNFEEKYLNRTEMRETCIFCENSETKSSGYLGEVCLVAVGAVAQQGSVLEPRSTAGRITTLMLFFTLMFLYVSYSANIVALLQSQSNSIKTLSDLLNSKLALGADDTIYNRHYFPSYTDPVRRAIWNKKMSPGGADPHFYPLEEGVKRMQKELFAFHIERGVGYKFINDLFTEDEKCGLNEILFLDAIYPWFSIQKNTSFRKMFKIGMRRIHETGLQLRENLRFYTSKPMCSSKGTFVSVGLVDIRPALIWIGSGCSFAVIIFLIEIFTKVNFCRISEILQKK